MSALLEALGVLGKVIADELHGHADRTALLEEEFAKLHHECDVLRSRLNEALDRIASLEVAEDAREKLNTVTGGVK